MTLQARQAMTNPRNGEQGLVLLALLLGLALLGIALLGQAQSWTSLRQQEAEHELLWVGSQYRKAIEHYYYATPGPAKTMPTRLEDLLEDRRQPVPVRHLRRLYRDPLGGELVPVLAATEIIGVASASTAKPFKRAGFDPANAGFEDKDSYAEWQFVFRPPLRARPSSPAANPTSALPSTPRAHTGMPPPAHSGTSRPFSSGVIP